MPGEPDSLKFGSGTKYVNGDCVRLIVVPSSVEGRSDKVVAAVWESGSWVAKSEGAVSVFSVMDAGLASDEELESAGLPFPEEPFVETALDGLDEEEHGELETWSPREEASPLFAKRADKERNVKLGARERALKG